MLIFQLVIGRQSKMHYIIILLKIIGTFEHAHRAGGPLSLLPALRSSTIIRSEGELTFPSNLNN